MGAPDMIVNGTAAGGPPIGGTGTPNTIPRWTGASTLGDSVITQSGSNIGFGLGASLPLSQWHCLVANNAGLPASPQWLASFDAVGSYRSGLAFNFSGSVDQNRVAIQVANSGSGGTVTALVANGSGNVGIGTTSPLAKLHTLISGTAVVSAGSDPAPGTLFEGTNTALTTGATSTQQLAIMSNSAVAADAGGGLVLGGKYTGNAYANFAAIKSGKDNATGAEYGGYLAFYTRTNGQAGVGERARIDSAGRFGIGTASPDSTLHVIGAASSQLRIGYNGLSQNYYDAGDHFFRSAGGVASRMSITSLSVDISAPGYGLKLPATPGNADTQTLDCYQENTWTPTLTGFGGTAPTVDTARFTRVGRLVYFAIRLSATGGANYSGTRTTTYISLPVAPGYAQANALMADNNVNSLGQGLIATNFGGVVFLPTFALTVTGTCISGVYEV